MGPFAAPCPRGPLFKALGSVPLQSRVVCCVLRLVAHADPQRTLATRSVQGVPGDVLRHFREWVSTRVQMERKALFAARSLAIGKKDDTVDSPRPRYYVPHEVMKPIHKHSVAVTRLVASGWTC